MNFIKRFIGNLVFLSVTVFAVLMVAALLTLLPNWVVIPLILVAVALIITVISDDKEKRK